MKHLSCLHAFRQLMSRLTMLAIDALSISSTVRPTIQTCDSDQSEDVCCMSAAIATCLAAKAALSSKSTMSNGQCLHSVSSFDCCVRDLKCAKLTQLQPRHNFKRRYTEGQQGRFCGAAQGLRLGTSLASGSGQNRR